MLRPFAHRRRHHGTTCFEGLVAGLERLESRYALSAASTIPSICGTVFVDTNGNGVANVNEGLSGVTLRLFRDNGDGIFSNDSDSLAANDATTDGQGSYVFDNLTPDATYFVQRPAQIVAGRNIPERISSLLRPSLPTTLIDSFTGLQTLDTGISGPPTTASVVTDPSILGTERDVTLSAAQGDSSQVNIDVSQDGLFRWQINSSSSLTSSVRLLWDGLDGTADNNALQLGGLDLTENRQLGFVLEAGATSSGSSVTLSLFDGTGDIDGLARSLATMEIPVTDSAPPTQRIFIPFTAFIGSVPPTDIAAIAMDVIGASGSITIDSIGLGAPLVFDFPLDAASDISVTMTDNQTTATPGLPIEYQIVVANTGPDSISGVPIATVLDQLSNVSFTSVTVGTVSGNTLAGQGGIQDLVAIAPNSSITYTVTARVRPDAQGTLLNRVVSIPGASDLNSENNQASDSDVLVLVSDLQLTLTNNVTSVLPGDQVVYTMTVTNTGPSDRRDARIQNSLPLDLQSVTYTSQSNGATGGTASGTGAIDDRVIVPAGSSITYTIRGVVNIETSATQLTHTATVSISDSETDPIPTNNTAIDTDDIVPLSTISGTVFEDRLGDGSIVGDTGFANQSLQLFVDNGDGQFGSADSLVSQINSGNDGQFAFSQLRPSTYFVQLSSDATRLITLGGPLDNKSMFRLTVASGQSPSSLQYAVFGRIALAGNVWRDLTGDGISTDDVPLPGNTLALYLDTGNGVFEANIDIPVNSVITDNQGRYTFTGLGPGSYFVTQQVPNGFFATAGGPQSDGVYLVAANSRQDRTDLDFANAPFGSINGNVYHDGNRNGVLDSNESGVSAWLIQLLDASGEILATTQTDDSGNYQFANLAPGEYRVQRVPTIGWEQTGPSERFATSQGVRQSGDITGPVTTADLDGDGIPEIIAVNDLPSSIDIVPLIDGVSAVSRTLLLPPLSRPQAVTAVDLDQDGDIDLVVPTIGVPTSPQPLNPNVESNAVLIWENDGQGAFSLTTSLAAGHGPVHVAADDLNQDGIVDLVVTNYRSRTIDVMQGLGRLQYRNIQSVVVGAEPLSTSLGDSDADGDRDVLVTVYGNHEVLLLQNNGQGLLTPATRWSVPSPTDSQLVDLDQDGRLDVLALSRSTHVLTAYFGQPSGFGSGVDWQTPEVPRSFTLADLNSDGQTDVVVTAPGIRRVAVLYGTGERDLLAPFTFTAENPAPGYDLNPQQATIVDVDRDGDLDIVVGLQVRGFSVLFNRQADITVQIQIGTEVTAIDFGQVPIQSSNPARRVTLFGVDASPPAANVQSSPLDVNRDGYITALDALLVINHLNRESLGLTLADPLDSALDCNGDGSVSAIDALWIINRLNADAKEAQRVDASFAQTASYKVGVS